MLRLVDVAEEYEDKAVIFDIETEEVVVVDPEAQAVADAIYEGIEETRNAIGGFDASNVEVKPLPGNVAGQFNTGTEQITLDLDAMTAGNAKLVADVIAHERKHDLNQKNGDAVQISSLALNEAITETVASIDLGRPKPTAYPEHMWTISAVAQGANTTRENLFRLYRAGENAEINSLFAEAANDDDQLAAAA